jgi:drug/metabolite transporter (DMT)-like permease
MYDNIKNTPSQLELGGRSSDTESYVRPASVSDQNNPQAIEPFVPSKMDRPLTEEDKKAMVRGFMFFLLTMVVDIGFPLGIYYGMKNYTSLIVALMVSSIPPLLLVIGKFIYKRKVDILGCLFVVGFVLSGIFALVSGDARLVLLRDSSVTCVVGACFLLTLIPIKTKRFNNRPLQFLLYAQIIESLSPVTWRDEQGHEYTLSRADWLYTYVPYIRTYSIATSALWGVVLEVEFIIKVILITSSLTTDQVVSFHHVTRIRQRAEH